MHVPLWIWLATAAGVAALLALSFFTHIRNAHEPTIKEAGAWTAFFVALSILFGVGLTLVAGRDRGIEFFAGYITEYSLSIDNLFVFVIIMSSFGVPRAYQQKVLLVGIIVALILRTIFILLGAAAIARFSWVFYIFGLFLILTGVKLAFEKHDTDEAYEPNFLVRLVQKVLPTTDRYDGAKLTTVIDGKRYMTPMMMVMLAIGMTDILFALDSIPAIYGLTDAPYIVFTANAFALLGLIELYFLIGGLLKRLVYLGLGLAVVLAFIGVKLIIEAMHTNNLPFLNGGEPIHLLPEIPTWLSLVIILSILGVTTIASLLKSHLDAGRSAAG
ncbi:MAG: TerC family protein [Xanthomonadales bacterium]|nr:TerC family protein [Xanthomonadales bacterium]ODU94087.1 MAG: tellurium resistance protein TerC [Rhodanobacter sp. SCN 66-43]OJY83967.1 MAG: tellurium resistance protein TerC [Xanthomonadales bacterium 66-474]